LAERERAMLGARLLRLCATQSVRRELESSFYSTARNEPARNSLRDSGFWASVEFSVAAICVLVLAGRTPFDVFLLDSEIAEFLFVVYSNLPAEYTNNEHVISFEVFAKVVHAAALLVIGRFKWTDPCLQQLRAMPDLNVIGMHALHLGATDLARHVRGGSGAPAGPPQQFPRWGLNAMHVSRASGQPQAWQLELFTEAVLATNSRPFADGSNLVRGPLLGEGSFGKVYAASRVGESDANKPRTRNGTPLKHNLAVKVSKRVGDEHNDEMPVEASNYREIVLWQLVSSSEGPGSDCIAHLQEVHVHYNAETFEKDMGNSARFESTVPVARQLAFVSQRGLEFRTLLVACARSDSSHSHMQPWRAKFAVQAAANILAGLVFLSKLKIVHGDLKAQNCLFNFQNRRVQITDWGSARLWAPGLTDRRFEEYDVEVNQNQTTMYYAAPENLLGANGPLFLTSTAMDVWSAGCMIAEIFTPGASYLFPGQSQAEQLFQIMSKRGQPPEGADYVLRNTELWQDNKDNWPNFHPKQIMDETFCGSQFSQITAVVDGALTLEPNVRPSAQQLLELPLFEGVQSDASIVAPEDGVDGLYATAWNDVKPNY
jgi:serine/threonine protein kinase